MSKVQDAYFMRQLDILHPDKLPSVTLVGYGGIGSMTAMFLAKMGVSKFVVYDNDQVDHHNVSNQMFPRSGVGRLKAELAVEEIRRYSPLPEVSVTALTERFVDGSGLGDSDVVISALDNMETRNLVWSAVRQELPQLYIDARMGGEAAKVYVINPLRGDHVRWYGTQLTQGDHTIPCTAQAICYNVGLIGSIIGSMIRRWVAEMPTPRLIIADALNWDVFKL